MCCFVLLLVMLLFGVCEWFVDVWFDMCVLVCGFIFFVCLCVLLLCLFGGGSALVSFVLLFVVSSVACAGADLTVL